MRTALLRRQSAAPARKAMLGRSLILEHLEPRTLMTATPASDNSMLMLSGHGATCQCPLCTGVGLDQIPVVTAPATASLATTALSALPQLSSNPGARAKLYLDFNGHTQASWGTFSNIASPPLDQDGNPSSWSSGELATIREVWARVAEDYAPFNIDVTTIDPGTQADGIAARVVISGNYSDWYGQSAGGVAFVGGFANSLPNIAYVFEDALGNGNPRYVAEAASHEAGHLFGLAHQAVWNGGTLVEGYNSGNADWAPIMGTGYYAARTTWSRGTSSAGPSTVQDDMAIIASAANGFGWRADDFGNTTSTAAPLAAAGTSINIVGTIGSVTDVDQWSFSTAGGTLNCQLSGSPYGSNLDGVLELRDALGRTIVTAAPANSLGASLTATLAAGTYYLAARSQGGYGNVGQYSIRGTLPPIGVAALPEISLRMQGVELSDGANISFGTTTVGSPVTRTFTVTNTGGGILTLSPLSGTNMPAGFSLASNLGDTSLTAGESTTFAIRFDARSAGNFSGQISLANNDSNEASFELRLSAGSLAAAAITSQPVTTNSTPTALVQRTLDNGASGYSRGGAWSQSTGRGVGNDLDVAARGIGGSWATWSFPGIANGKYQVYASWPGGSANASNAPLTLYNGSSPVTTVRMDQRSASAGLAAEGTAWRYLGTVTVTAGRLNVRLTNAANGAVVADAVRIMQMPAVAAPADLALLAWLASGNSPLSGAALAANRPAQQVLASPDSTSRLGPDGHQDLLEVPAAGSFAKRLGAEIPDRNMPGETIVEDQSLDEAIASLAQSLGALTM